MGSIAEYRGQIKFLSIQIFNWMVQKSKSLKLNPTEHLAKVLIYFGHGFWKGSHKSSEQEMVSPEIKGYCSH